MLEPPAIVSVAAQPTASIRLTVPAAEMRSVMGPGLAELRAVVAAQGVAVTGAWFTHHLRRPAETFDFEIGLPVAFPVTASGRVAPGELPAGAVARTVYRGPYEQLGAAWGEFEAWIAASGRQSAPDLWECYLDGPGTVADSALYRAELNRPLLPPRD